MGLRPGEDFAMPAAPPAIYLRRTVPADIPGLFEIQLDPIGNQLAGTKPRDLRTFTARWDAIFGGEPGVIPRVIIADEALVGSINVIKHEGTDSMGYWIAREHWGRGIASRALAMMLREVAIRPLFASVAGHNAPSLRVLERNGFVVSSRGLTAETERTIARETVTLRLV